MAMNTCLTCGRSYEYVFLGDTTMTKCASCAQAHALEESIRQQAYAAEQASKNAANEARWAADAAEHRARLAAKELEWSRPTRERTWQEKEADRLHEKRAEEQEWRNKAHRRSEELRRYAGLTPRQREVERKKEITRNRNSPWNQLAWEKLIREEMKKYRIRWLIFYATCFLCLLVSFSLGCVGLIAWFIASSVGMVFCWYADEYYYPWLYETRDAWVSEDD